MVERKRNKGPINRRDLTLLERISQIFSLSIAGGNLYEKESLLRETFQKFVPTKLVNDLVDKGEILLQGEKKHLSIAFVDIRDFTQITSQMPPEQIVLLLNRFYSRINKVAKSTEGIIDKLLGDGALVLWGVYGENPNKESQAMKFVLTLRKEVAHLNKENEKLNLPPLKIGVGINSGETIIGLLGDEAKMEHTAVGSAVNLASRLEKLCKIHQKDCVASLEFLNKLNQKERKFFDLFVTDHIQGIGDNITLGMMDQETINHSL